MDISFDVGSSFADASRHLRSIGPESKTFDEALSKNVTDLPEEEEKKKSPGLPFPSHPVAGEREEAERLKSQAMQIASQANGELTPSQEAQIKAIEKEVGEISGMPMTESLVDKAKEMAKQNKLEGEKAQSGETGAETTDPKEPQATLGQPGADPQGQAGQQMLHNNALATKIKSLGMGHNMMGSQL